VNATSRLLLPACFAFALVGCSAEPSEATPERDVAASATEDTSSGLERVIAFADTRECVPGAAFATLLKEIAPMDDIGRPVEPFEPRVTMLPAGGTPPKLTKEGFSNRVDIELDGSWHGLQLTGLSRWWTQESDHDGFDLHFANPPAQVVRELNALGFDLDREGQRTVEGEVSSFLVVTTDGAGAIFTCSAG
jgi:hypothetical protein